MKLDVRFIGVNHADFWDANLETILLESLERFRRWVKHVCLYIEDVNGPRGGVDKQCRCVVHLRRMPPVVVQTEADNMNALIYRTATRASYSLNRKTKRRIVRGASKNQALAKERNQSGP